MHKNPRELILMATPTSGVRHRFQEIALFRTTALARGWTPAVLWPASVGVAGLPFADLFAPLADVDLREMDADVVTDLQRRYSGGVRLETPWGPALCVGAHMAWGEPRLIGMGLKVRKVVAAAAGGGTPIPFYPMPAAPLAARVARFVQTHRLGRRLGLRVRLSEALYRADHRLDLRPERRPAHVAWVLAVLRTLDRDLPVYLVTDSLQVQRELGWHFRDLVWHPKAYLDRNYVDRNDPEAMKTFVVEAYALLACPQVINIGGVLTEALMRPRQCVPLGPDKRYHPAPLP